MKIEEEQQIINFKALIEEREDEIFKKYLSKLICKALPKTHEIKEIRKVHLYE